MYLRESRRTNRDGSVVAYLQLAHNQRHPQTGNSTAKVIHNFGRADQIDRDALARLVASISRYLTPEQAAAAARGGQVEVLDSRRLGGAWTLDRLWERLGIGAAIRAAAAGRRLDGDAVERVVFALVAQRAQEMAFATTITTTPGNLTRFYRALPNTDDVTANAVCNPVAVGCIAVVAGDAQWQALTPIIGSLLGPMTLHARSELEVEFVCPNSAYADYATSNLCPKQP